MCRMWVKIVYINPREKCPGLLQKLQLVCVCGGPTGCSVRVFTAVRALTKESVICSMIAAMSSVFISVNANRTTVVVRITVAVDGGGNAGVPCRAYRAASWTSPKS